jgi:Putative bacterial sensory transduction regulator
MIRDRPTGGSRRPVTRQGRHIRDGADCAEDPDAMDPDSMDSDTMDPTVIEPITIDRVRTVLDGLDVRFLNDPDGALLAMWERHAVMIAIEGPADEILMMRVRPHATVPRDWADRAYRVVNEWNHSRRFYKAYVGDVTDRGQLPIYAEVQVPLTAGLHQALLAELLECGVSVAQGFVEWLHDDGCLL